MNTLPAATKPPTLPITVGQWRAVYWEPVMLTGERICVGFLTTWEHHSKAVLTLRPDLLSALFGAAGNKAQTLLERAMRMMNSRLEVGSSIVEVTSPMTGIYFGPVETCHANSHAELLQVGKLMSSSLFTLSEPDHADTADAVENGAEQSQPARQFATRVRDLVIARNINLAGYFNKEATLMAKRRSVRFGFLSDSLAAHFGLLQPTKVNSYVRMARGLMAELSLAAHASGRTGLLILGYPPLASPNLTDKERSAIADYTEELELEAQEFKLRFAATDNDAAACDALLAAL